MVSTRSTVQKLIPLDPELEQNLRRRRREQNLQFAAGSSTAGDISGNSIYWGPAQQSKNGVCNSRGRSAPG
ncbi:hypothetical protein ACFX19_017915 [Malus domestica]